MSHHSIDLEELPARLAPPQRARSRYGVYALVLLIIVLFALIRFRLRDVPLERDEGEYAYAGQLILQGVPPYQLAYNMKLPGTYAAYAALMAALGQTPAAIHIGLIFVNAATIVLLYFLTAKLFGQLAGVVAAASHAVLSISPSVLGLAAHASHFVVLPAVAGIVLLLQALASKRTWLFFASGTLLGLAFLMKQPGILFSAFALLYLVKLGWREQPRAWRALWVRVGALCLGIVLPFAITCAVLAAAGVFGEFWFWTFSYARQYGSILTPTAGAHVFAGKFPQIVGPSIWIWLLAAAALTVARWDRPARRHSAFLFEFLLFSFLAVCPGFYFREHYFILVLPAVAIRAGVTVSSATQKLKSAARPGAVVAIPVIIFLGAFGYAVFKQRAVLFQMDPLTACRAIYGANPFPEALKIAEYVRSRTSEADQIAVLGSEPEIYFYSGRRSATGYLYTYALMEPQKYAVAMQQQMTAEIEAAHPKFLVAVHVPMSWFAQPDSPMIMPTWAQPALRQDYELDGVVDISSETEYRWGNAAKAYKPSSPYVLYIFRRKAS